MDVLDSGWQGHDRPVRLCGSVTDVGYGTCGRLDIVNPKRFMRDVAVRRVPLDPLADQIVTTARVFRLTRFNGPEINVAQQLSRSNARDSYIYVRLVHQIMASGIRTPIAAIVTDRGRVYGWVAPSAHRSS